VGAERKRKYMNAGLNPSGHRPLGRTPAQALREALGRDGKSRMFGYAEGSVVDGDRFTGWSGGDWGHGDWKGG
jgi:hypothetical protein